MSGRAGPSGAKPREFERKIYLYICMFVYLVEGVRNDVRLSGVAVRVKGGKSLRNGMWHGVRNGIIMRNTIYAGNKLSEERILFSRQFYKSCSIFDVADY